MATTTDVYKGGLGGGTGLFPCPVQCHEKTLDLAVEGAATMAVNDVYNIFAVPAGTYVFNICAYIDTADAGTGGTLTFSVGDALADDSAVDVNAWIEGADAETASAYTTISTETGAYALSGGKFYSVDSLITVKFLTVPPVGTFKARFKMLCVPVFP